ncbi:MAG TPA: GNAT family N-acetyltransferase [Candidatus Pelethocola excrementipullorum]|nr:GNAT family N-acetyltransferase [Candidatus Pelethocola excrementipullorum]
MEKEPVIRTIDTHDYEELLLLVNHLHSLHVQNRPDIYQNASCAFTPDEFENRLNNPNNITLVAQVDGQIAGLCMALIKNGTDNNLVVSHKTLFIEDVCVHPSFRRLHVGTLLLNHVESMAKALGIERIDLSVWSFNETALSFYSSWGMKPQRVIMEKKI